MKKIILFFSTAIICMASCNNDAKQKTITQQKDPIMAKPDFTTSFLVDQSPDEVFKAVTNVRGWWSEQIDGSTEKPGDQFDYHYKDVHAAKIRVVEVVPNKKVVWLIVDNFFSFTKDKHEWKDNKIVFEITEEDGRTRLQFTQNGLTPANECYETCKNGWDYYINGSLRGLVMTGKGEPSPKESDFNNQLLKNHKKK